MQPLRQIGTPLQRHPSATWLFLPLLAAVLSGCTAGFFNETAWSSVASLDDESAVVYGSPFGGVVALDPTNEVKLWQFPEVENPRLSAVYSTPINHEGLIYFGDSAGTVWAVTPQGKDQWDFATESAIFGSPVIMESALYIGSTNGRAYALNTNSGNTLWTFPALDTDPIRGGIWGTVAVDEGTVYIPAMDGTLYAVDASTGLEKWNVETGGPVAGTPLVDGNTVYFGSFDRKLYSVDARTGVQNWSITTDNWLWTLPVLQDNVLFLAGFDGILRALDPNSGTELWRVNTDGPIRSPVTAIDEGVVFGSQDQSVYAISPQGGELWSRDLSTSIYSRVSSIDGILYAVGQNGRVYALDPTRGTILWEYDGREGCAKSFSEGPRAPEAHGQAL